MSEAGRTLDSSGEQNVKRISRSAAAVTVLIAALAAGCGGGNEAEMIASARTSMSKQDYKTAIVQL
jgi:hypothetical protein